MKLLDTIPLAIAILLLTMLVYLHNKQIEKLTLRINVIEARMEGK